MLNRINTTLIAAVVMTASACVFTGCEQSNKKSADSLTNQNILTIKCIVSYLQPDSSRYYTEQTHKISPQTRTVLFTAVEPQGKYEWSVAGDLYTAPHIGKTKPFSPELMFNEDISAGLAELYLANPITGQSGPNEAQEKLNLDGRIYNKVNSASKRVTLFSDQLTGRINTAKTSGKTAYILRAYNYQPVKEFDILMPTKIDIYAEKAPNNRILIAQFICNSTEN